MLCLFTRRILCFSEELIQGNARVIPHAFCWKSLFLLRLLVENQSSPVRRVIAVKLVSYSSDCGSGIEQGHHPLVTSSQKQDLFSTLSTYFLEPSSVVSLFYFTGGCWGKVYKVLKSKDILEVVLLWPNCLNLTLKSIFSLDI